MKKKNLLAFLLIFFMACNDAAKDGTEAFTDAKPNTIDKGKAGENAKEERNRQTAMASLEAVQRGDAEAALKDADKDIIDYGEGSMPPVKGVDSTTAWLKAWIAAVPDYKITDLIAVADGDYVMVYGTWTGTWKNDLMGMKATGKSFRATDVDIFKFNDEGKIIEHRAVQSMGEVARQIGMPMTGK